MPRLKGVAFETAIIERYRRRESSVEEALIEMYLAGVSVRRVEDITEALWGSKVSPATISELNKKAYVHIEDWRNRPLQGGRSSPVFLKNSPAVFQVFGKVSHILILFGRRVVIERLLLFGPGRNSFLQIAPNGEGMKAMITDAKDFGRALRKRRQELGYTQAYASACSGFSVSDLKNGKNTAELGKALVLANLLGLDCSLTPRG